MSSATLLITTQKHIFTFSEKTLINIITCRCFYWNSHTTARVAKTKREQNVSSKRTVFCVRGGALLFESLLRARLFAMRARVWEESIDLSGARSQECARWRELVMIGAPSVDPGRWTLLATDMSEPRTSLRHKNSILARASHLIHTETERQLFLLLPSCDCFLPLFLQLYKMLTLKVRGLWGRWKRGCKSLLSRNHWYFKSLNQLLYIILSLPYKIQR